MSIRDHIASLLEELIEVVKTDADAQIRIRSAQLDELFQIAYTPKPIQKGSGRSPLIEDFPDRAALDEGHAAYVRFQWHRLPAQKAGAIYALREGARRLRGTSDLVLNGLISSEADALQFEILRALSKQVAVDDLVLEETDSVIAVAREELKSEPVYQISVLPNFERCFVKPSTGGWELDWEVINLGPVRLKEQWFQSPADAFNYFRRLREAINHLPPSKKDGRTEFW